MRYLAALSLLLAASVGAQQAEPPNAVVLIAKPELVDPNFRETVVLVTQTGDGSTVGVVLNRPTDRTDAKTGEPVYYGGPVLKEATVVLFRTESVPGGPAFRLLKDVYLAMHPDVVNPLLARPSDDHRIFAGFSGWMPGQLENELDRDDWLVMPAAPDMLFRKDTKGLWRELLERAWARQKPHVRGGPRRYTFAHAAVFSHPPRHRAAGT